ncbi:MAG: winged helix-turn-helix domain-containing protein [Patescibacteria group bacterium]
MQEAATKERVVQLGGLAIHLSQICVMYKGRPVSLLKKSFLLLDRLAQDAEEVVEHDKLHTHLYGSKCRCKRNLDTQASLLRRALASQCEGKNFIKSVRSKGYKLINPDTQAAK